MAGSGIIPFKHVGARKESSGLGNSHHWELIQGVLGPRLGQMPSVGVGPDPTCGCRARVSLVEMGGGGLSTHTGDRQEEMMNYQEAFQTIASG